MEFWIDIGAAAAPCRVPSVHAGYNGPHLQPAFLDGIQRVPSVRRLMQPGLPGEATLP